MFAVEGQDNNPNVWMSKIIIAMLIEKGPEYQSIKGYDKNSNTNRNSARIPRF